MRVCAVDGCPEIYPDGEGSKCLRHRREADKSRGTATRRGYTGRGHQAFRRTVLARDPVCVLCNTAIATVADHYPNSRRQQEALGLDPDDPTNGRGLCKPCHDKETALHQPGGFRLT